MNNSSISAIAQYFHVISQLNHQSFFYHRCRRQLWQNHLPGARGRLESWNHSLSLISPPPLPKLQFNSMAAFKRTMIQLAVDSPIPHSKFNSSKSVRLPIVQSQADWKRGKLFIISPLI
ncbi:hypothetical protein ABFX02_02G142100 [Erythranthe guttata]